MTRTGYLIRAACAVCVLAALLLVPAAAAAPRALEPNDPYWRQSWSQSLLRMPEAWQRTTGSPDVIISTVDTGVNPSVQDLQGQLIPGWDFLQNDAVPRDTVGHGTHVASVIGAQGNNGIGIAGYCWTCRIMPVRITRDGKATGPQIAQGVYWAVDHGARVITIGLNSPNQSYDERVAMRYARDKGVLVIASAGNTGADAIRYPAGYPDVLAVAGTTDFDALYFWSTRGSWVQLAAPGCQLVIDPSVGPGTLCGTSFTPAVVAGIVGLMLSLKPSLTPAEIVSILVSTSVPVPGIGGGRIDPVAALNAVAPPPAPPAPASAQAASPPAETPAPATGPGPATARKPVPYTRTFELRSGVLRTRVTRIVSVGTGRLDVQLHTSLAQECQLSIRTPRGEFILSLLPPLEQNLLSMSERVPAGRYRVEADCDPARRRSYTLGVSAVAPPDAPARPQKRRA